MDGPLIYGPPRPASLGVMAMRLRVLRCIGIAVLLIIGCAQLCRQLTDRPRPAMAAADAGAAVAVALDRPLPPALAPRQAARPLPRPPAWAAATVARRFPDEVLQDPASIQAPPAEQPANLSFAFFALLSGVLLLVTLLTELGRSRITSPLNDLLLDLLDEDSLYDVWLDASPAGPASPLIPTRRAPIQVLTDVDDTIKSSGGVTLQGVYLGGIDGQYPRGEFYPGVFRFMLELSMHNCVAPQCPLPVAVLTARAREFLFALELDEEHPICRGFSDLGRQAGVPGWGIGDVLYGSVAEWLLQDRKGWRKLRNFRRLVARARSERQYVFVGDTGERDQEAGEAMLDQFSRLMAAVFLHVVVPGPSLEPPPMPADRLINGRPLLFFRTYVGAALKAVQHDLMGPAGLRAVMAQARRDLEALEPRRSGSCRWAELEADLAQCEAYLKLRHPSPIP